MRITEKQYQELLKNKKTPKYRNKKVIYNNIKFDSAKERNYYMYLQLLEQAGIVKDLELQKKFILQKGFTINNKKRREISYIADFCYISTKDDKLHVIDVKSPVTAKDKVYRLKKKLFEYKYGIEIEEV